MPLTLKEVQTILYKLGFRLVGDPELFFDPDPVAVEMGVREFQRYAKMPQVAKFDQGATGSYVDKLTSALNTSPYAGTIHGVADDATSNLLVTWDANQWRCPVVIQAWKLTPNPAKRPPCGQKKLVVSVIPDFENLWLYNDLKSTKPRVFAYDFSGYFTPVGVGTKPDRVVLGTYFDSKQFGDGPAAEPPNHTLLGIDNARPGTEVRPKTLLGKEWGELSEAQQSTFRVIRSVSEVECFGYFDSINAYDTALLSIGLCHWTMGLKKEMVKAELPAYFSYLQKFDSVTYEKAVGKWGVGPQDEWGDTGVALFNASQRKYETVLCHRRLDGQLIPIEKVFANYYRGWHWVYRIQAAARYVDGFRLRMWDMARLRLRDILTTPFSAIPATAPQVPLPDGTVVGDVFTSELALAFLLRWHIRSPGHVISGGKTAPKLNAAFKIARNPKLPANPGTWKTPHELRLINGIKAEIKLIKNAELSDTIGKINTWPAWRKSNPHCYKLEEIGRLGKARGSIKFDDSGLPAPPDTLVSDAEASVNPTARKALFSVRRSQKKQPGAALNEVEERPVLYAYQPGEPKPTYLVTSNGSSFKETREAKYDRTLVDHVVLFNRDAVIKQGDEKITAVLLTIPILPARLDKLELQGTTTLLVRGSFRCWLPHDSAEQSQRFRWAIEHRPGGTGTHPLQFTEFRFDNLTSNKPVPILLTSLLDQSPAGKVYLDDTDPASSFEAPLIAEEIGLRAQGGTFNLFPRRLDFFQQNDSASPVNPAQLLLRITQKIPLLGSQQIKPFPFEPFSETEMRLVAGRRYSEMSTRQPGGDAWDKSFTGLWLFEFQFPAAKALAVWNAEVVDKVIEAINVVQEGRPVSILPKLGKLTGISPFVWSARYTVVDRFGKSDPSGKVDVRLPGEESPAGKVSVYAQVVTPYGNESKDPVADVVLEGLQTSASQLKKLQCRLALYSRFETYEAAVPVKPAFNFGVKQKAPRLGSSGPEQKVRMGALELSFLPVEQSAAGVDPDFDELESRLLAVFGRGARRLEGVVERDVAYDLKVLRIEPGGQDNVPGDEFQLDLGATLASSDDYQSTFERGPSVLLPTQTPTGDLNFFLSAVETTGPRKSQTLNLRLRTKQDAAQVFSKSSVIIIDPEPFLIARVRIGAADSTIGLTDEIGNWSTRASGGTGWELSAGASGFDLVLPPQGIGEEMHRRIGAGDIEPRYGELETAPIDFRFARPTVVALQPSFFRQRFAETPWNLRRVLGYPGQRAPGAGVDRINFELLYGMAGEVTYPFLRLAEVASRLGYNPGQQPPLLPWRRSEDQKFQYENFRNVWQKIYTLLKTRLAIIEPYDPNQPKGLIVRDTDGLSFTLRSEAGLKYPIPNGTPGPDLPPVDPTNDPGIAGGFTWAFESKNIYEALWRNKNSNTAALSRPYFSSLGGWGHQKATFDNRRTTIFGDTVMGRTATINVERIGRIGNLWNRAKHVIVYQRSVVPSRQFFLEQEPFIGNAILRKVDEYVEILEQERAYPDNNADALTRGPVLASRFSGDNPPRIRVNSRWGEDLDTTGWAIPLWIRGAAPGDVYPKPLIHLVCAGAEANERVPVAIREPEKLFFYTNTDPNYDDNTDLWPSVVGIDLKVLPVSDSAKGPLDAPTPKQTHDPEKFLEGVRDEFIPQGGDAFTIALEPSPKPVNLVVERTSAPISTVLGNVMLMRGVAVQKLDNKAANPADRAIQDYFNLHGLKDTLGNSLSRLMAAVPNSATPFTPDVEKFLEEARGKIGVLREKATAIANTLNVAGEQDRLGKRINAQLEFMENQLRHEVEATFWRLDDDFRKSYSELEKLNDFPRTRLELARRFTELIEGGESFEGYAAYLDSLPGTIGDVSKQMERALTRVQEASRALQDLMFANECEICRLDPWPPAQPPLRAKEILAENHAQLAEGLTQIEFIISEVPRQWLGDRLDNLRNAVRAKAALAVSRSRDLRYILLTTGGETQDQVLERFDGNIGIFESIRQVEDEALGKIKEAQGNLAKIDPGGFSEIFQRQLRADILAIIDKATSWAEFEALYENICKNFVHGLNEVMKQVLGQLISAIQGRVQDLYTLFFPDTLTLQRVLSEVFGDAVFNNLAKQLKEVKDLHDAHVSEELENLYGNMRHELNEFVNRAAMTIKTPSLPPASQIFGLNTIRLLRAFGEPPRVPNLTFPPFNAELKIPSFCGYYLFDPRGYDLKNMVDRVALKLTPLLAQANSLAQSALNAIEVKLPTSEILDRFKPHGLENFDLSRLFPNFAGLKLDALFRNLRPPAIANDHVKVTHGVDPQTRTGWVEVNIDFPVTEPTTVFSLAGVTLRLLSARFQAVSRIEAGVGQSPRQTSRGSITGDWDLRVGEMPIAILASCSLTFEEGGKISFSISPDRVKLQQVLAFLADLMASFGYSDQGFSIAITPTGIRTVLDLPLPDIQSGTFGIANLRLGFLFALNVIPEFQITTSLSVGRKTAPFTLTIFILGGAGWLEVGVNYFPATGRFDTFVSVGIMAAASLAIALGPIKGGVYAYFGITVEYVASNQNPSRLTMGLLLLFAGEVSLLGLVTVGMRLGLEAQYTEGGGLKGRGFVSYTIKICWFLTIDVQADVEYTFGKSSSRMHLSKLNELKALAAVEDVPSYKKTAEDYINMFV